MTDGTGRLTPPRLGLQRRPLVYIMSPVNVACWSDLSLELWVNVLSRLEADLDPRFVFNSRGCLEIFATQHGEMHMLRLVCSKFNKAFDDSQSHAVHFSGRLSQPEIFPVCCSGQSGSIPPCNSLHVMSEPQSWKLHLQLLPVCKRSCILPRYLRSPKLLWTSYRVTVHCTVLTCVACYWDNVHMSNVLEEG